MDLWQRRQFEQNFNREVERIANQVKQQAIRDTIAHIARRMEEFARTQTDETTKKTFEEFSKMLRRDIGR